MAQVRGLGLRRSDRESQKSEKSQKSNASAGSSDHSASSPTTATPQSAVTSQPLSASAFPSRAAGSGASLRHISVPPHLRLHRVPEDGAAAAAGGWSPPPMHHETFYYDDFASEDEEEDYSRKNVPIWLCLCVVIAYIVWGAFIFRVTFKH